MGLRGQLGAIKRLATGFRVEKDERMSVDVGASVCYIKMDISFGIFT